MKQVTNSLKDQRKLLFGKDDKIKLWKSNKLNALTANWKSFQVLVTKLIEQCANYKMLKRKFYEVEINLQVAEEKRIAK